MRDLLASLSEISVDEEFHRRNSSLVKAHFLSPGLPNLARFMDFLDEALRFARQYRKTVAVFFVHPGGFTGLDDFSLHHAEDVLLEETGKRLSREIRRSDCVARLNPEAARCRTAAFGSDAFAICLPIIREPSDATKVARRLHCTLSEPFFLEEREVCVTTTIGVSLYPFDGEDAEALLRAAKTATQKDPADGAENADRTVA